MIMPICNLLKEVHNRNKSATPDYEEMRRFVACVWGFPIRMVDDTVVRTFLDDRKSKAGASVDWWAELLECLDTFFA